MSSSVLTLERFDVLSGGNNDFTMEDERSRPTIDIERLKAEAYSQGFAAGKAAMASREADTGQEIGEVIKVIQAELDSLPEQLNQQVGLALKVILEGVLPALCERGFAVEAAMTLSKIKHATGVGAMHVAVSPQQRSALGEAFEAFQLADGFSVTVDANLHGATARISWPDGGVEIDHERVMKECLAALDEAVCGIMRKKGEL